MSRATQHGALASQLWSFRALVVFEASRLRTFLFDCRTDLSAAGSSVEPPVPKGTKEHE